MDFTEIMQNCWNLRDICRFEQYSTIEGGPVLEELGEEIATYPLLIQG